MNDFQIQCLKANEELRDYINNELSQNDFNHTSIVGEGGDISANIDLIAEDIFIKYLLKFGDIYSEESGIIKSGLDNGYKIILDPLDGSDNFLHRIPYYGTSIALQKDGVTVDAFIYNLVDGQCYTKENQIITQNNPQIGIFERSYASFETCDMLYNMNLKYRSSGAVALSLANAINLKFVLFYGKARQFDLAAGLYICSDLNIYQNDDFLLVCKDTKTFEQIKEKIKE